MFDGPIEEGIEVLQPFLNRTARAVSAETACTYAEMTHIERSTDFFIVLQLAQRTLFES